MNRIFFALPGNEDLTRSLARICGDEVGEMEIRSFPDGETFVRVDSDVRGLEGVLVCSLHGPNPRFLPLYFLGKTVQDLGARSVCLVAPYLSYMRQDKRFHPGEGITSQYFAPLISSFADRLITVDPHLHRTRSLSELYGIPSDVVHSAPRVALWIRENVEQPVLVGPDSESEQWVAETAARVGCPYQILQKIRNSDTDVQISIPEVDLYRNHTPVLVDDIISTAQTMIRTVQQIREAGMKPPVCIGVHGLFAGTALGDLQAAGVKEIVTCNTIPHPTNRIWLDEDLAEAIRAIPKNGFA